jgi:hypothetical protein
MDLCGVYSSGWGKETVASSCEHSNESSEELQASQGGLYSMKLIKITVYTAVPS